MEGVFTAIIYGQPVSSKNSHLPVGHRITHTPEYRAWWDSALEQLNERLEVYGHYTTRATVRSRSGKNRSGMTTVVMNPLLDFDAYRMRVWFFRPAKLPQTKLVPGDPHINKDGSVSKRKVAKKRELKRGKNNELLFKTYSQDTVGILEGVADALQESGVFADDEKITIAGPVYACTTLPDGAKPFLVVEVSDASEPVHDDGLIPSPPVYPQALELYMPRVFEGVSRWYEEKRQEQAFQDYLAKEGRAAPAPVSKIRCKRCHILVGPGHVQQEIWAHYANPDWGEERWPEKVVLICGACAKERFETDRAIAIAKDLRALVLLKDTGSELTVADPMSDVFVLARTVAEQQLWREYCRQYCLVSKTEIGTVAWTAADPPGIYERQQNAQKEVFGAATTSSRTTAARVQEHDARDRAARERREHSLTLAIRRPAGFRIGALSPLRSGRQRPDNHGKDRDDGQGSAGRPI
jgi:hypothetical protein